MKSVCNTEAGSQRTSIAAKAVALVARPVVESAKIGLMCSAARPCAQENQLSCTQVQDSLTKRLDNCASNGFIRDSGFGLPDACKALLLPRQVCLMMLMMLMILMISQTT